MNWTTHICPYLLLKIEILDMFETLSWFVVSMWSPLSPSLVVSCAVGFESQGTRRFASILSISTAAVFCQWWPCSITAVRPMQPSHSCPLIRMLGRWFLRLWHLSHGLEFQSFKLKLDARYEQTIQNIEHIWTYCVHRAECAWIISHVTATSSYMSQPGVSHRHGGGGRAWDLQGDRDAWLDHQGHLSSPIHGIPMDSPWKPAFYDGFFTIIPFSPALIDDVLWFSPYFYLAMAILGEISHCHDCGIMVHPSSRGLAVRGLQPSGL